MQDKIFRVLLILSAVVIPIIGGGIVYSLTADASGAFEHFGFLEFYLLRRLGNDGRKRKLRRTSVYYRNIAYYNSCSADVYSVLFAGCLVYR